MSSVRVEDFCLWPAHIEGNPELQSKLINLSDGEIVILRVGRASGAFVKMKQGKNIDPTPGLKPACDASKAWWNSLYSNSKGKRMMISEVTYE
jgi:hypothetical protein